MTYAIIESPIGDLTLVASELTNELEGIYMNEHRHRPELATFGERINGARATTVFGQTIDELSEYFDGHRRTFTISGQAPGTTFQKKVWQELKRIPYGETITYSTLAERIDNPRAVRAVGLANGRNPFSIVVPCHRVVGRGGSLTGYGGGLDRKRYLLEMEARHVSQLG